MYVKDCVFWESPPPVNVVLVPLPANFVKLVCMHVNNCTVEEYP